MSKYVIKNCPAYKIEPDLCVERNLKNGEWVKCQDCTDCLLKQIVEKCKRKSMPIYENEYFLITQEYPLAKEILELLDIQEVE